MQLKDIAQQLECLLKQIEMDLGPDTIDQNDDTDQPSSEFIPPLQSELELIKHNAGIESAYDDEITAKN